MKPEEEMRFISCVKPPLVEGKYRLSAKQEVTRPENCSFEAASDFHVTGRAYSLDAQDVFSVFPTDNESGEFADVLPYIVLDKKTYPWIREICPEHKGSPVPWVALIVVSATEGAVEKDMPIAELTGKREIGIYFPDKTELPSVTGEKGTDMCHVVELPIKLYSDIMPSMDDMTCLCHARSVNLSKTEDNVCAKDGFFSVVCANRFVPSGEQPVKSTVHLVSMLGYAAPTIPMDCKYVRLVSLYHWDIYSQKKSEESFASVVERLRQNCGVMGYDRTVNLQQQGCSVLRQMTRTGEQTYAFYRSPLIPFRNTEQLHMEDKHTADGLLVYDEDIGMFEVTYAAAWQLGRMLTLNRPSLASSILGCRKAKKLQRHRQVLKASINFKEVGLEELTVRLVQEKILDGVTANEEN